MVNCIKKSQAGESKSLQFEWPFTQRVIPSLLICSHHYEMLLMDVLVRFQKKKGFELGPLAIYHLKQVPVS